MLNVLGGTTTAGSVVSRAGWLLDGHGPAQGAMGGCIGVVVFLLASYAVPRLRRFIPQKYLVLRWGRPYWVIVFGVVGALAGWYGDAGTHLLPRNVGLGFILGFGLSFWAFKAVVEARGGR